LKKVICRMKTADNGFMGSIPQLGKCCVKKLRSDEHEKAEGKQRPAAQTDQNRISSKRKAALVGDR